MLAEHIAKPSSKTPVQQKKVISGKSMPSAPITQLLGNEFESEETSHHEYSTIHQGGVKQLKSAPSNTLLHNNNKPIQRVGVELRGAQTLGAKFNAFFFGKESTYTLLQKKYKEYLKGNTELKGECINLANKWLVDHGSSKDPNDIIKHESIDELLRSLNRTVVKEQPIEEVIPVPNPVPGPDPVPNVVKEDDPIVKPKIEYISNIDTIEILHDQYKEVKNTCSTIDELLIIFNKLSDFVNELKIWDSNFAKEDNPNLVTENIQIAEFRQILLDNYTYESEFFSGTISDLNEEDLLKRTFSASSMSVTVNLPTGPVVVNIKDIKISQSGFEFKEFSIEYKNLIGFAEIFSMNESELTISSKAKGFEITAAGELGVDLGIEVEITGKAKITYDTQEGSFKKPEITEGGFEYKPAIGFKNLVSVENISGKLNVEDEKYKVEGSGDLSVNFGNDSDNAKGTVNVVYEYEDGLKIESITDGEFNVKAFGGLIEINGSGLNYDEEGLKIDSSSIKLNLGEYIPELGDIEATGTDIEYKNGEFDWESIKITLGKEYSFGGMTFSLGDATLYGKSKGYIIEIENAGAGLTLGSWLKANGEATFTWDILKGEMPKIESSTLQFLASSPVIPGDIIPGILPIGYSITIPFVAGVVPMQAGVSMDVDANAQVNIGGEMTYSDNEYGFNLNSTGKGELKMGIKGFIDVGNSFIFAIGGFIEGATRAKLEAGLALNGKAAKKETGFDFSDLSFDYNMEANIKAELNAGIHAKALFIFERTLYKMKIKEWDLGKAEKTGSVNLFSGKEKNKGNSKGILEFGNEKLPNPIADTKTLPFVQKMDAVTKIIDGIKLNDGLKNEAELLAAKVEIMRLLQESIDVTVNDENFKKIEKRLQHYILKLGEIKEKYDQWSLRQEIKKQQPDKFADKFKPSHWGQSREEHYIAKLATGVIKHKQYVKRNEDKKDNVLRQFNVYNQQITESKEMMLHIDKLLDPLNEVESISAEIAKKETLENALKDLIKEIDISEKSELRQAGLNQTYISELESDNDQD
jgi:hypothetical protein